MKTLTRAGFVALSAAAAASAPRRSSAQPAPLRIGSAAVESYSLVYLADAHGFFKDAGLKVQITSFRGGGAIMAAAAGGALDIACANVGAQSNAHVHGLPFAMIAAGGEYTSASPTTVLAVAEKAPFRTAKDLNGKTVGVSTLKDLLQVSVMKWVDENGGDSSTLKFVEISPPEMAPALVAGRIDASTLLEPALTFALEKHEVRTFAKCFDAVAKKLMIDSHFGNTAWLDKNVSTVDAVIVALRKTARWANVNHAATAEIVEKIAHLPPGTASKMNRTLFGETLDPATIQPVIDATAQYHFLPKSFPVTQMFWAKLPAS